MDRLKSALALLLAALFVGACSSGAGNPGGKDSTIPEPQAGSDGRVQSGDVDARSISSATEQAVYAASRPIDLRNMERGVERGHPALESLPELPQGELPLRLPSEITDYTADGSDDFLASANAVDDGTAKLLQTDGTDIAWAIYQVPGVAANTDVLKINVNSTPVGEFGEETPTFWVGIANYDTNRWQILAQSSSNTYQRFFSASDAFKSPGGNLYFFLLINKFGRSITSIGAQLEETAVSWEEIPISFGPNDGWTPQIELNLVGDPIVVFADYFRQNAYVTVGDHVDGLLNGTSWAVPDNLDPFPPFVDETTGNKVHWLDMHFDQQHLVPVVSMVYEGQFDDAKLPGGGAQDSTMLCFAPYIAGEESFRLYYGLWSDGAKQTSIHRDVTNPAYGIVLCAENLINWAGARPNNDLEVRYIEFDMTNVPDVGDGLSVQITRNFGNEWELDYLNPHMRFDPLTGNELIAANGAHLFSNDKANTQWLYLVPDVASNDHGAVLFNPFNDNPAHIFTLVDGNTKTLTYFDNVFSPTPASDPVHTVTGASVNTGLCQEIAFTADGQPHIVFTEYDGTDLYIRYAFQDGDVWTVEEVSTEPNEVTGEAAGVRADIAVNSDGVPMVVYNHTGGGGSVLHFATRVTN